VLVKFIILNKEGDVFHSVVDIYVVNSGGGRALFFKDAVMRSLASSASRHADYEVRLGLIEHNPIFAAEGADTHRTCVVVAENSDTQAIKFPADVIGTCLSFVAKEAFSTVQHVSTEAPLTGIIPVAKGPQLEELIGLEEKHDVFKLFVPL
jgi:hypothetical protein